VKLTQVSFVLRASHENGASIATRELRSLQKAVRIPVRFVSVAMYLLAGARGFQLVIHSTRFFK
jgi:hypothetical protein